MKHILITLTLSTALFASAGRDRYGGEISDYAEPILDMSDNIEFKQYVNLDQYYNVRDYGATGDGVTDDRTAIADADTAGGTLVFPAGTYKISSNITIASHCIFYEGAFLDPDNGDTVTITGTVDAGTYAIVDPTAAGTVAIGSKTEINTIWYAASGVGTDGSRWVGAPERAIEQCGGYREYFMPAGRYEPADTITIDTWGVKLRGSGWRSTIIIYEEDDGSPCIDVNSGVPGDEMALIEFSDFRITGSIAQSGGSNGTGINLQDVQSSEFTNLHIDWFTNTAFEDLIDSGAWISASAGTNEYYFDADPNLLVPVRELYINGSKATEGTAGALSAGEWDWDQIDDQGFYTVYVRLPGGGDPDAQATDYVKRRVLDATAFEATCHFKNHFYNIRTEDNDIAVWQKDGDTLHSGQDSDFWTFQNCYWFGREDANDIGFLFTGDKHIQQRWDFNIWYGMKYGIYYATDMASVYRGWSIEGGRYELQSDGDNSVFLFLRPGTNSMKEFTIRDFQCAVRLADIENCDYFRIDNVKAEDTAGSYSFIADATSDPVIITNYEGIGTLSIGAPEQIYDKGTGASGGVVLGLWGTPGVGNFRLTSPQLLNVAIPSGYGTADPNATGLHIMESEASAPTPDGTSDILILEANDNAGMTILSPNNKQGTIAFGDSDNSFRGAIVYDHAVPDLGFRVEGVEEITITATEVNIPTNKLIAPNVFQAGNDTNNITVSAEGVLELNGDARAWKSQDLKPGYIKHPSANPPDEVEYQYRTFDAYDDSTEEQVFYIWHVPDDFATGTGSLKGNFQGMVSNEDGAEYVAMGFEYWKISPGDTYDISGAVDGGGSLNFIIANAEGNYVWHTSGTGTVDTTGWAQHDICVFRFFRDVDGTYTGGVGEAEDDDYTGDVLIGVYHLEYLIDKLGSGS